MALGLAEERARFDALFGYCQDLERIIGLLVIRYGQAHEGGYRIAIDDEDFRGLLRFLGTTQPTVLQQHDLSCRQLVVDVL